MQKTMIKNIGRWRDVGVASEHVRDKRGGYQAAMANGMAWGMPMAECGRFNEINKGQSGVLMNWRADLVKGTMAYAQQAHLLQGKSSTGRAKPAKRCKLSWILRQSIYVVQANLPDQKRSERRKTRGYCL